MRKIQILILIITFSLSCYSQDNENKNGFIGISIGPSFPEGDFAKKELYYEKSGLAINGLNLKLINFGYNINKFIGITGILTGAAHPIDIDALLAGYSNIEPSLSWEIESSYWYYGAMMGGLLISLPNNDYRIDIDIRALIGLSSATTPELKVTATDGFNSLTLVQEKANSSSTAYNIGMCLRYIILPKLYVNVNIDYFFSEYEFNVTIKDSSGSNIENKFEQPIESINLTFGLAYRIK
ncbi:MAG: hypothetical protein KAT68_14275 [Bacteroidales bacterium]|nr:hypothetical protein [Bacteroidales bacterium]